MISSRALQNELLATFARNVREQLAREVEGENARAEERRARVVPMLVAALVAARGEGLCGHAWLFGSFAWGSPGETAPASLVARALDQGRAL